MPTYSSLKCSPELLEFLRKQQREFEHIIPYNDLHITFCFFGRRFKVTPELKQELIYRITSVSDKKITFKCFDVFHTRRGDNLLVVKLNCSQELSQIRNEIYVKYNIPDKIFIYNPHITLGKLTCTDFELPQIVNKDEYEILGVDFH